MAEDSAGLGVQGERHNGKVSRERIDALRNGIFDAAQEMGATPAEIIVACAEIMGGAREMVGKAMGRDVFAEDAAKIGEELKLAESALEEV